MSNLDYFAGLIDGEGSIMLTRAGAASPYRYPVVSLTNTSEAIIEWLRDTYGGQVVAQKTYKDHHKQAWIWKLRNDAAYNVCISLAPLLKDESKRYRANLIVTEYKGLTRRNGKYTEDEIRKKLDFETRFLQKA